MNRLLIAGAATLVLVLSTTRAHAGYMYLEWMDCNPTYKLWEVSWHGPWSGLGGKHLDQAASSAGPWKRVQSFVPDNGCYFPAENLRWYRLAKPKFPLGYQTLASIWVPRSRCSTIWVH